MLARFRATAAFVEVVLDLVSAMASSLRRRRVPQHPVDRRLALALRLQLELALHSPTRLRVVVQACLEPLLCSTRHVAEYQDLFQYGTR